MIEKKDIIKVVNKKFRQMGLPIIPEDKENLVFGRGYEMSSEINLENSPSIFREMFLAVFATVDLRYSFEKKKGVMQVALVFNNANRVYDETKITYYIKGKRLYLGLGE